MTEGQGPIFGQWGRTTWMTAWRWLALGEKRNLVIIWFVRAREGNMSILCSWNRKQAQPLQVQREGESVDLNSEGSIPWRLKCTLRNLDRPESGSWLCPHSYADITSLYLRFPSRILSNRTYLQCWLWKFNEVKYIKASSTMPESNKGLLLLLLPPWLQSSYM